MSDFDIMVGIFLILFIVIGGMALHDLRNQQIIEAVLQHNSNGSVCSVQYGYNIVCANSEVVCQPETNGVFGSTQLQCHKIGNAAVEQANGEK